jgi:hypothetical protein
VARTGSKFDAFVKERFGNSVEFDSTNPELNQDNHIFEDEADDEPNVPFKPAMLRPEVDDFGPFVKDRFDNYLNTQIKRAKGDVLLQGTVKGCVRDHNGMPVGRYHENSLLDTREYQVLYSDGSMEELTINIINESTMSQVDAAGKQYTIFKDIVGYRTNEHAVKLEDGYTVDRVGRKHRKITAKGWELSVKWTDGTTEWLPLKDLKESHPIQVAEFAINNKITDQPAFAWWVHKVMRHRDCIIKKVKSSVAFSRHQVWHTCPSHRQRSLRDR